MDIEDEDSLSQRLEMQDGKSRWMRRSSVCRICQFYGLHAAGTAPAAGRAVCFEGHELGAPTSSCCRGRKSTVDDLLGCGSAGWKRLCSSWPRRHTGAGRLRRLDAGPDPRRPHRQQAAGSRLCGGWVCCPRTVVQRAEAPRTGPKRPSPPPLCGCRAGRLRDPHRRDRGGGRTLRPYPDGGREGLCAGQ